MLKAAKDWKQVTYKVSPIKTPGDFSVQDNTWRAAGDGAFQTQKCHNFQHNPTHPVKVPGTIDDESKSYHHKSTLEAFMMWKTAP